MYYDVSHNNKGKNRLIWTIPNPEEIEDRLDYNEEDIHEEKSLVEKFNNMMAKRTQ